MQKHCIGAKKNSKKISNSVFLTNQIKPIKFLLNAGVAYIIKYFLVICILLC
jgi:hypothetical protein